MCALLSCWLNDICYFFVQYCHKSYLHLLMIDILNAFWWKSIVLFLFVLLSLFYFICVYHMPTITCVSESAFTLLQIMRSGFRSPAKNPVIWIVLSCKALKYQMRILKGSAIIHVCYVPHDQLHVWKPFGTPSPSCKLGTAAKLESKYWCVCTGSAPQTLL